MQDLKLPAGQDVIAPEAQRSAKVKALSPKFTTRDVADLLGVSTDFVLDEIKDRRLLANQVKRGQRTIYRIEYADLKAYCEQHWPRVRVPAA